MDYPALALVIFLLDKPLDTLWIQPVLKVSRNSANTFNILAETKRKIMAMESRLLG